VTKEKSFITLTPGISSLVIWICITDKELAQETIVRLLSDDADTPKAPTTRVIADHLEKDTRNLRSLLGAHPSIGTATLSIMIISITTFSIIVNKMRRSS
jgi:hypothetical protein